MSMCQVCELLLVILIMRTREAQIHYNQLDQLFSITDLQDFMGIVDVSTVPFIL